MDARVQEDVQPAAGTVSAKQLVFCLREIKGSP